MNQNIILVPTDFTTQADNALKYAFLIKEKFNGRIVLLHIVSSEGQVEPAHKKLEKIIVETEKNYGIKVMEMIRKGDVFEEIGRIASEIGAVGVVMGTHGVTGMQHIFGSKALKVISTSKVPFISVTKGPKKNGFDKIVMPINLNKEPNQLISLAISIARSFDSEIHVIGYNKGKSGSEKYENTIKDVLDSSNVAYVLEEISSNRNFDSAVLKYAKKIDADLIAISHLQENVFNLFGGFEQSVVANKEGVPVMVVNFNSFGIRK